MKRARLAAFLPHCVSGSARSTNRADPATAPADAIPPRPSGLPSNIQHVVIIVQENRSVDNLFHGLPGADTANYGYISRPSK